MATGFRNPTDAEKAKLEKSRNMMVRGIEGEKDFLSKISTTMAKSARDEQRAAKAIRESVPEAAREGEGMNMAPFKKGGKVSSASSRADGCAMKGKTKGMMVKMKSGGMC
jgi:hypothetical protein